MLRNKNAYIVCLFRGLENILLARLAWLARISHGFAVVAGLHFRSKPWDKLRVADFKLLFADEIAHFEATLFAVLLGNHNTTMVVVFVLDHELFQRGCIDCKFGADAICPEVFDQFYSGCAENSCVEAGNENITLFLLSAFS